MRASGKPEKGESEMGKGSVLPFVFYILGSLCFLAGSIVSIFQMRGKP